jgi:hypothetical protein
MNILDKAKEITSGERRRDYDSATPNHKRIAILWNAYDQIKAVPGSPDSPLDVVFKMILLKIARAVKTPSADSLVDIAGYARCGAQIAGFEKE